uniref:Uncharacterized protein n=1 Tax=Globisporangium ultimum (strain ATCC 200006 / CBS 805.95 / DAOM BR144) TaxID=431595 RepID=K3WLC1_GLOUD
MGRDNTEDDKRAGKDSFLSNLIESAAQVLAPNSLEFQLNEHEFQRSPKEAQDAAHAAAKLVQPGDLIFITTSGFLYSMGRYLTGNDYDHVVVVLDAEHVLHVGMPSARLMPLERLLLPQRQPVVLRVDMEEEERQKAYQLVLRLTLKHMAGSTPLRKLPLDIKSDMWICSDSIMVLLAGCSEKFRDALMKARQANQLDLFNHGSASLSDFTRIRGITPEVFTRVALPLVNYTLVPQKKSWKEHIPELVHFMTKLQAGKMKWPMLEETMFPKLHQFASQIPPTDWSMQQKASVMGYSMVLLIVLKRGMSFVKIVYRVLQLVLLRYMAQQLLQHLDKNLMAKSILSKLNMVNVTDAAKHAAGTPKGGLCMLIIDQQVDFHPGGSLAIPTANDDAERITAFITKHSAKLSQLVFTLDSHQRYHIAHGIFWEDAQGESPAPFTLITNKEIADGVWRPRDPELKEYVLAYTQSLEKSGKFTLCIWPEHCVIGTPGHNLVENVRNAALEWTKQSLKQIQYVMKGSNSFTEHYSALRAEFELSHDPATSLNQNLVNVLKHADKVVICGEALSHCVNYTVRDLVDAWPAERIQDLVILTDCASPVTGFESSGEQFLSDMAEKGLTLTTSAEFEA